MTSAVCWKCGAFKLGAFGMCTECSAIPESDDELAVSLSMTDHYFKQEDLETFFVRIKNGIYSKLADETRKNMMEQIHALGIKNILVTKQDNAAQKVQKKRPWWKFWG